MHTRNLLTAALLTALLQSSPVPSASVPTTGTPTPQATSPGTTRALAQPSLSISVPTTADLGTASPGSTHSAQLGTVTATGTDAPQWDVTATATALTTTGGTIATSNIAYWSGPATVDTGHGACHPGKDTATQQVTLNAPRTAFHHTGSTDNESCSWNPTLVITVPANAVVGHYTGTITHSVA
ncbi:hypothetical protein OOK13_29325 [Streptomyces sp. NBC_00378]|uniref:hypothetical protein n=1 Tax=unclassified Streptomyces TaxID=2593676 RepID=UPI002254F6DB|nr:MULTISPECIES: hypothetical protein [unclassified Streptomyces]MCX5112506.1 hypothetical protein [Streptomyces sp. NBC_00378]